MEIIKKNKISRFEDGAKIPENEWKIVILDMTELLDYAMGDDSPNPVLFSELYKRLVAKAQEDGTIDEEESTRLKTFRTQMLVEVRAEAHKDHKISDDERCMLTTFVKIFKTLGDFEL